MGCLAMVRSFARLLLMIPAGRGDAVLCRGASFRYFLAWWLGPFAMRWGQSIYQKIRRWSQPSVLVWADGNPRRSAGLFRILRHERGHVPHFRALDISRSRSRGSRPRIGSPLILGAGARGPMRPLIGPRGCTMHKRPRSSLQFSYAAGVPPSCVARLSSTALALSVESVVSLGTDCDLVVPPVWHTFLRDEKDPLPPVSSWGPSRPACSHPAPVLAAVRTLSGWRWR